MVTNPDTIAIRASDSRAPKRANIRLLGISHSR